MTGSNTPISDVLRAAHTHPATNVSGDRQCVECRETLDADDGPVWCAWTDGRCETVAETFEDVPVVSGSVTVRRPATEHRRG